VRDKVDVSVVVLLFSDERDMKTHLELVKVDLVHSLTTEETVHLRLTRLGILKKSALRRLRKDLTETLDLELGLGEEEGGDGEGANGSGEGGGEGVDVGSLEENGGEVGEGGEEDGGGSGGGGGSGEGQETGDVRKEVGVQDQLPLVASVSRLFLVEFGGLKSDEGARLFRGVEPVLEGVPGNLGGDPLLRSRLHVDGKASLRGGVEEDEGTGGSGVNRGGSTGSSTSDHG
jgi:hypothetical protein